MPYQGGYVPDYHYGNHSGNYGNGQAHVYHQQNGQAQSQQPGGGYSQQMQMQMQQTYQQPALQTHTPYTTPQYYNQAQRAYGPGPSPSVQYQQPYLSPPQQPANLQQNIQYSPDPLHRYQPPPQPRQTPPQSYQQQQQQQPALRQAAQPSHTPQAGRSQSSQRQSAASPQWSNLASSPSPYESSLQTNARSVAANSYITSQRSSEQSSHARRPQGQPLPDHTALPASEYTRPSPMQRPQQANPRPNQQVMPSQPHRDSAQGHHSQHLSQRPQSQHNATQTNGQQASQYSAAPAGTPSMIARPSNLQSVPASTQKMQPPIPSPQVQATASHIGSSQSFPSTNSSTTQRRTSNFKAEVQPSAVKLEAVPQARSPKRRKSNNGASIPICQPPATIQPPPRPQHIKQEPDPTQHDPFSKQMRALPASSPLTELASSQMPPTPPPSTSIDYRSALLALSDDYISAAYSMTGSLATLEVPEELLDRYQNLLSTGLGCLDSVLKNYRISDPRQEARVRLRYASLLYEETENLTEAEECLSKGISLCERARLTDLKYAMHHLTARIWFKSRKFKTAMKTVERLAAEADKLQLLHWIYAFHFLRVSFGLQIPDNHHETVSLVRHLTALSATASRYYHVSVQILASTLEALVHLIARSPDSVDLANRAMASARMHQLTPAMDTMPQVRALLDFLDVACSVIRFDRKAADAKLQTMQSHLDQGARDDSWTNADGCTLLIDLGHGREGDIEADSGGVFHKTSRGDVSLAFSWLTKHQAYALGFLVSGLSKLDGSSGHEATKFLQHVLVMSRTEPRELPLSQSAASERWQMQLALKAAARLYITFAFSGICDWSNASNALRSYKTIDLPGMEGSPSTSCTMLATYLEAVIKHGSGELDAALQLYRSDDLQVKFHGGSRSDTAPVDPIKVLAALNSVEILHLRGKHKEADMLLDWAEQFCIVTRNSDGGEHGSRALESLFYMLKTTTLQRAGGLIIDTKSILQRSVKAAQGIGNNQLLMVVMNFMTDAWFKNIVGQQACSSGKLARGLAGKIHNNFWQAIATRMYADTLELTGQLDEAERMRQDAQRLMASLPSSLLEVFQKGGTD
ncbi:Putative chromatid cohesion factor MAU2 [Septoria linicola]|uniref:Chromatid cohesion factor MAU2 n=1 Tax=Septoria linicola TaxID=215465 RepID=A0A9Q9AI26_9PEZI|nr:putative chromatid cohesion factor MAU2 [Septoria linicola]USW49789.1 Putative chromatid cohesion factor MAU2 [Septoria linicola]